MLPRQIPRRRSAAGNQIKQEAEADENPDALDESLDDIRPDDGLHPADDRVKNRHHSGQDHYRVDIITGHRRDRDGEVVEHETHLGKMAQRKCQRAVCPDGIPKPMSEIFIRAHAHRVPEKGNDHHPHQNQDAHHHEARHEFVPVAEVSRAGIRNKRDAADDRRVNGNPHRPAWDGPPRHEILIRRSLPPRKPQADKRHRPHVEDNHRQIQSTQCSHTNMII